MGDPIDGARGVWAWWPLRLLVFFFALVSVYAGCQIAIMFGVPKWHFAPHNFVLLLTTLLGMCALIVVYRLLVRWMERRRADEIGATHFISHILGGALLGTFLFGTVYGVLWACGAVTLRGVAQTDAWMLAMALSLAAGVGEELIFRGAVYRLLEEGFGTLIALIVSGAFFGLLHGLNPGATLASTLAIAFEAGILLAAAYALTRSLWLAIGLHFGWNFAEGGIFGAAVSGHATKGWINATISGPDWLSGGKFGPEASLPAFAICVTVAIVMLMLVAKRGQWKPMRFRLRAP